MLHLIIREGYEEGMGIVLFLLGAFAFVMLGLSSDIVNEKKPKSIRMFESALALDHSVDDLNSYYKSLDSDDAIPYRLKVIYDQKDKEGEDFYNIEINLNKAELLDIARVGNVSKFKLKNDTNLYYENRKVYDLSNQY